jgi:4-amino-4-deoxy-L-arabinose transferase-like glycosyltransferase
MALGAWLNAFVERHGSRMVFLLLTLFAIYAMVGAFGSWRLTQGFEAEWVAQSIAAGHGYSFPGNDRWLFEPGDPDKYYPTAWTDPLFTFIYAALLYWLGEPARLVMMLLSLASFTGAALLVARTARYLAGPWAALATVMLLLITVQRAAFLVSPAPLAALWIALLLFYLVWHADRRSGPSGFRLGAILGLCMLTWSSTMILVPVTLLLVLWVAADRRAALWTAAATVAIAMVIVAPWTLRNYLVFDEFVPVRAGLGQIAHVGTVGLGGTFAPKSASTALPTPWTSSGPFEATARVISDWNARLALKRWQVELMKAEYGPGYDELDEVQRDKWYFRKARDYVLDHPVITAQLTLAKLAYLVGSSPRFALAPLLGLVGGLLLSLRQRLLVIPLALAAAYAIPFTIIVPYFYRYRLPIEPVLAVLVGVVVAGPLRRDPTRPSGAQLDHP